MSQDFLHKLTEIIEANIGNSSFGARELSQLMGMSHTSLWRKVQYHTEKSITQHIKEIRLRKALEILQEEDVTVSEVTFRLGFSSPSYFTACFGKFYGYPPGEVKKKNGNGKISQDNEKNIISRLKGKTSKSQLVIVVALSLGLILTAFFFGPKLFKSSQIPDRSIAVLPFKLLSNDSSKQFLADGMRYAIQQKLGEVRDLRVIPVTTVEQYRNTVQPLKKIGQRLGAGYVIEGSFQMVEDTIKLMISLNQTKNERQVWADDYIRAWTYVFKIQSDVSQKIAAAVEVYLSPWEIQKIESVPTNNLTAYQYYLRAYDFDYRGYNLSDKNDANGLYRRATEVDSTYALAWVGLARCNRYLFWEGHDRSVQNLSKIKQYLDRAVDLSPGLKEVRLENACYYYQCKPDYNKSLKILEDLRNDYPLDAEIQAWTGYVFRRTGDVAKGLEYIDNAISLNPSNWFYYHAVGLLLDECLLPESKNAEKYFLKAIELNPSQSTIYKRLLIHYVKKGHIVKAKEILKDYGDKFNPEILKLYNAVMEFYSRNYDDAIKILQTLPDGVIDRTRLNCTRDHFLGFIYRAKGNHDLAAKHFNMEREFHETMINDSIQDWAPYASLAYAYAGLGMKDKALEANKNFQNLYYQMVDDDYTGHYVKYQRCIILTMAGEYDLALKELEPLMKQHGIVYYGYLKYDPIWDVLRDSDEFREIMSDAENQVSH